MKIRMIATTVTLLLSLVACTEKESEEGIIPEGYEDAVEKARGVENTMQDAMQKHSEEMEERAN